MVRYIVHTGAINLVISMSVQHANISAYYCTTVAYPDSLIKKIGLMFEKYWFCY